MTTARSGLVLRLGLLALAGEALLIGVHALFFPRYFYEKFLLGRGWVSMLPPYNEHITRDLGALYLGFAVLLGYAVLRMSRDVVDGAVLSFGAATVPHMVYHLVHLEAAPKLMDKVLQSGLLAVTILIAVALLLLSRRYFAGTGDGGDDSRPPARAGARR